MRGKINRRDFSLSLLAVTLAAPVVSAQGKASPALAVAPADARAAHPQSSFRITYIPYRREGFLDMPIRVFAVAGQATAEPLQRRFSLKNQSDKAIDKVEVSMHVIQDKHAIMPVLNRKHSSYVLAQRLMPGGEQEMSGEDKLSDLFGPLLVGGKLSGNYRVEVLVSKVQFADGSTWNFTE